MIYLGIDPGQSGGIAVLNEQGLIGAWPMPETERDILDLIREFSIDASAVLEQVRSRPGQGVAGMFTFGWSYGGLRMALLAAGVRFTEATPQTWQKVLGLNRKFASQKDRKNAHKARAQELFPGVKVTHATADALLLAECAKKFGSPLLDLGQTGVAVSSVIARPSADCSWGVRATPKGRSRRVRRGT